MANELKIKSSIDLNTTKAFEQLSKFKSDAEKLKAIDIKVNIQGLDKVETELRGLLELSNKISKDKIGLSIKQPSVDTSSTKKELEYLKKYKDTYKAIEKLKQQKAKGVSDDSLKRINSDIERLQGNLDKYKSKIQDVNKIKLFEESQDLSSFVKAEQSITNIINKAEKLQKSFSGIEFKNVDSSKLESDINKTVSKIEELQTKAKQDINIDIDLNNAINDLNRLDGELKNLKELDSIKGVFANLEGSMKDAFGTEYVEKLRGEIEQLESTVLNLDGAFDRSASSVRNMMNSAQSDMRRVNSEMRNSSRFASDFVGSFSAYTAGNVIGDGIVRGIREIKDAFLEIDQAMTNVKKVANPSEIDSVAKLDEIRSKAIATAKDVGQSSAEVMNAVADTLQAGIGNMKTSMDVAKQTMMFANVGELRQEDATSAVNTMIKGFKVDPVTKYKKEINGTTKEVTQLTEKMDVLNFASNNYGTSAQQLVDGLQNGATVLGSYGVSLEDTVGMMTAGIEILGNGNKVGNGLKSIGINLAGIKSNAKDGTLELNKTAKTLKEVAGVDVYSDKKKGQLKSMTQILDEVYSKWNTFSDEQQKGLSEAIAGKQQASVFQALMQNFETYKKMQKELSNGEHYGSMEAENARYVDSISGKLNKLKETWVSIGTTIVSSDFTKGLLDGAIAVSEAIEKIVQALDKMNMLAPVMSGLGLTFGKMIKNSLSGGSMFTTITRDLDATTQKMTLFQRATNGIGNTVKGVGGSLKSAGSMLLGFGKSLLTNAGIMIAVTAGIKAVAWGYDKLTNSLGNAEKQSKENMESIKNDITNYGQQLNMLTNSKDRYAELIEKQNEYRNSGKDLTQEQQAEMQELIDMQKQLADTFPELVIGTDSQGNPILSMSDDVDGLIKKLELAVEQKNRLLDSEENKDADTAWKQAHKGEILGDGGGILNRKVSEEQKYARDIKKINDDLAKSIEASQGTLANSRSREWSLNDIQKAYNAEKEISQKHYESQLDLYQEYSDTEQRIQKGAMNKVETQAQSYKKLQGENKAFMEQFSAQLNWMELDKNGQNSMVKFIDGVSKELDNGNVKVKQYTDAWSKANEEFAVTGDKEKYAKDLEGVAKGLSAMTNVDYGTVMQGLTQMFAPLDPASQKLQNFLKTYNRSLLDLQNGDGVAKEVAEQFNAVNNAIEFATNPANIKKGTISLDDMVTFSKDSTLPQEIRDFAEGAIKDSKIDTFEHDTFVNMNFLFKQGKLDGFDKEYDKLQRVLDGQASDKELQVPIKIGDVEFDKDTLNKLNGWNKNNPGNKISIDALFNVEGLEKLDQLEQGLDKARNSKGQDIKLLVDVVGQEKADLYYEIISKIKAEPTMTNKFILENQDALSQMKNIDEVKKYLQDNPEIVNTYQIKGFEKIDEAKSKKKDLETKGESVTEVKVEDNGATQKVDEINDKKKKLEEPANLTVNNGELQGSVEEFSKLIEYSTKLKDGEYQLSFKSDTGDSIAQIEKLKLAVNNLSNQFSQIPNLKINIETAQSAQNITGLKTRIDEFKALAGTVTTVKFNTDTATASKNVTGLKNNVSSYVKSYCGKSFSTKFNCQTALASQNVSGLRRNVSSYVSSYGGKTFTTTFKVVTNKVTNVSTVNTGGGKGGKSASGKSVQATTQNVSVASASSVQPMSQGGVNAQSTPSTPSVTRSAIPRVAQPTRGVQALAQDLTRGTMRMTNFTPIAIGGGDIANGLEYNIDLLKELDAQLKIVTNRIDLLNKKAELATGKEKINYLKEQNNLYKEQQEILDKQEDYLTRQKNYYEYSLKNRGVTFNSDGNMTNYEELLIKKEKEVKALEQKANKEKASDSDKKKYESAKSALDDFKKYADEYYKVTFDELPKVQSEWQQLENDIRKNAEAVKNLEREQKLYTKNTKLKEIAEFQDELADKQDIINEKMKHASGEEQVKYHKQLIELSETYLKHQNLKIKTYKESLAIMQDEMKGFGFTFDTNGSMENIDEVLNKLQDSKDLEYVNKLMEEYIAIQRDKLPEAQKEWEKLNNEIIDSQNAVKELNKELSQLKFETAFTSAQKHVDELNNALEMLDVRLENAFGENKSELLQEKVDLLHKQKQEMLDVINILNKSKNDLKGQLTDKGFNIDEKGNIRNYDSHMAKLKGTLSKEEFDEIEKLTKSYLDLLVKEIPEAEREWENMNNEIIKHQNELEKVLRQIKLDVYVNKLKDLENEYDRLADKLDIVDAKLKYAHGIDKVALLEKQRELLEEQMKLQDDVTKQYESMMKIYQTDLSEFGVKFNEDGDILNLDSILNKYQGHQDIEKLKELIDEYLEIQRDKLPDAEKKWEDLNNAIKDSYKEQLQLTKDVEDKITEVYKKQVEERKKLIDKELDNRLKALKKEQDAYNKQREEHKYNTNYQDQMDKVKELEKQLEVAKKDDSIMGKKRVEELLKQLKEEQKKLEDMVQDKIDSDINDMYDEESNRLQEEADKAKEDLDEKYSDDKLQQIVKDALTNGVFVDIDGNIKDLQDTLLDFEDKFGDGMSAMGSIIKSELIANLETAKETIKDMSSILDDMDLSEFKTQNYSFDSVGRSVTPEVASSSNTVQFNSPLINIEGNVDNNVVDELKKVSKDIENNVVKKIVKARR